MELTENEVLLTKKGKEMVRKPVLAQYTKEQIIEVGMAAKSPRDFMIRLGYQGVNGTSYKFFVKKMEKMGIDIPDFKYVEFFCVDCGKKTNRTERCGKCAGKLRRGENNHNWKGGAKPTEFIRESHKMKKTRREVFNRDGNKCVECGGTDRLSAHHVFTSFKTIMSNFIDEFGDDWMLHYEGYEPLWNLDNFKTLCTKCHWEAHGRDKIL